jgi:hypothetical protein
MWPLGVVVIQIAVQVCQHLLHRPIPGCPPLDTEVFIQQCAMQSLDKTVIPHLILLFSVLDGDRPF